MDHRSNVRFVDAEPKRDGSHQHVHFIVHPALLVSFALGGFHFRVVSDGSDALHL